MRARHRLIGGFVPALLCLSAAGSAAAQPTSVELAIELRVLAAVPGDVLREAKEEVERTFIAAGVRIVWIDPGETHPTPRPLKLVVVGVPPPARRGDDASGETILGVALRSRSTAHVFYDRVAALVAQRQVPVSLVLAHVMAHELGHLLLSDSHESFGIMRRDVPLEHPSLRRFTDEQSRLIRAAIGSGQRRT